MSSEIIQNVAYENYDDFQHFSFIFSQNFISLFWLLFSNGTDLRVRYQLNIGELKILQGFLTFAWADLKKESMNLTFDHLRVG